MIEIGLLVAAGMAFSFICGWMAGQARGHRRATEACQVQIDAAVLRSQEETKRIALLVQPYGRPTSNADDFGGFPG